MPRNNREYLQRFAGQVLGHLDTAIEVCETIKTMYGDVHPEYTLFWDAVQTNLMETYETVSQFKEEKM